jgi:hypothetical protein
MASKTMPPTSIALGPDGWGLSWAVQDQQNGKELEMDMRNKRWSLLLLLDNLEAYKHFPLSVFREASEFRNGTLAVSFKPVSGRVDQAAGIAFNIQPNGDYLVVRANSLENDEESLQSRLVLFHGFSSGRFFSVSNMVAYSLRCVILR